MHINDTNAHIVMAHIVVAYIAMARGSSDTHDDTNDLYHEQAQRLCSNAASTCVQPDEHAPSAITIYIVMAPSAHVSTCAWTCMQTHAQTQTCVARFVDAVPPRGPRWGLNWLHLGIADGMPIARVWACRYSKRPSRTTYAMTTCHD